MNFFKKTFVLNFSILFLIGSAFAAPANTPQKKLVDKIAAIVNQDIILNSEFETFKKSLGDELKKTDKTLNTDSETFQKRALEQMIEDKLTEQEVRSLGLEATDNQLENVVSEVMKSNGLNSRKELDRALRSEGVTYDEFMSEYKKRIGRSNLVNQIIRPKIKISDDEIDTEYKKRTQSTALEMEYQVSMLFIAKGNTTLKQMEKLRKSITSLTEFAKNADNLTEGPGKGKGGDMGWIDAADLQSPLNENVKKLKKGNISPLITAENGYYILACTDMKSKASAMETKVKNEIQDDLMNTLITKNLNQYLLDLKQKAHIEKFI